MQICLCPFLSFNSQPHARLTNAGSCGQHGHDPFNSQPHARLTQILRSTRRAMDIFQFTASCEADLVVVGELPLYLIFNSQPHARLTHLKISWRGHQNFFNSQPHARLTSLYQLPFLCHSLFQFTASCEADQVHPKFFQVIDFFNSQPHARLTRIVSRLSNMKDFSIHSLMRG